MSPETTYMESANRAFDQIPGFHCPVPDAAGLEAVRRGFAVVTAPGPAEIRLRGKDAEDYLHRRLSASIRGLRLQCGVHALQLSGDGRMEADVQVYALDHQEYSLLVEARHLEATVDLLDKYILMEDIEIIDDWARQMSLTFLGAVARGSVGPGFGGFIGEAVATATWAGLKVAPVPGPARLYLDGRWKDTSCFHIFADVGKYPWLAERLMENLEEMKRVHKDDAAFAVISPKVLNYVRIANGVTVFGQDTTDRTLPLEANLRNAVDFEKGCFPGQEILARINNLGHPAHVLARLRFEGTRRVTPGDEVREVSSAVEGVGIVTSAQTLDGVEEGLALASLPWRLRECSELEIVSVDGSVAAQVELLGEYPDRSGTVKLK